MALYKNNLFYPLYDYMLVVWHVCRRMKCKMSWFCPDFSSSTSTAFPSLIYFKCPIISITNINGQFYHVFKMFLWERKSYELTVATNDCAAVA